MESRRLRHPVGQPPERWKCTGKLKLRALLKQQFTTSNQYMLMWWGGNDAFIQRPAKGLRNELPYGRIIEVMCAYSFVGKLFGKNWISAEKSISNWFNTASGRPLAGRWEWDRLLRDWNRLHNLEFSSNMLTKMYYPWCKQSAAQYLHPTEICLCGFSAEFGCWFQSNA